MSTRPNLAVDAEAVGRAHERVRTFLPPTRLIRCKSVVDRQVFLKLETEQPTGSFKVRGALSNLLMQPFNAKGFVTASAGNHGLGVAWAAQQSRREEPVTIFVPQSAPTRKIARLQAFRVDLRIVGGTFDDALRAAKAFESETGATFIDAYDDPLTAAGQGTLAIEVFAQLESAGAMIIPVGGGGLISGSAAWVKAKHPETRIIAVQPEASPSLAESIRQGRALLEYPAGPTLADGLAGGIGQIVFDHRDLIDEIVSVPEADILAAIRSLHYDDGIRAEASAAITRAALDLPASSRWPDPVVCVLTGSNIDDDVFAGIVAQEE